MTPEAQRIAIAQACGWQGPHHPENVAGMKGWWSQDRGVWWVTPQRERVMIGSVPDYLNDLNAMHEAKRMILTTPELCEEFNRQIVDCRPPRPVSFETDKWSWGQSASVELEAFLRTLNLWQE